MCLVTDTQTTKREANLPQTRPCNNGNNDTNINNNIYNNNNVKNNSEHGVNYCSHPNNQHAGNHANTNDTTNNSPNVSTTIPSLKLSTIILWSILTYISKEFSLFLPRFQSKAGAKIFISASYNYDDDLSFFDDTILTWGTDYAICIIMLFASYQCFNATTNYSEGILLDRSKSKSLRIKSSLLFFSYAISVFAGGYAHYTFTEGTDQRNTTPFRIWWTICVGSVTAAGGFMGSCASEIYLLLNHSQSSDRVRFRMGYMHDFLWVIYGGFLTYVCIMGEISYQRPACDIFVAGTSQFIPTVYCVLTVLSVRWTDAKKGLEGQLQLQLQSQLITPEEQNGDRAAAFAADAVKEIHRGYRYMLYIGFFLNAPLLPTYPAFIQYTSLSLGMVNAILHSNLTIAWGMQAWSLRHICQALNLMGVEQNERAQVQVQARGSQEHAEEKKDQ
jgi:hypothetical protein